MILKHNLRIGKRVNMINKRVCEMSKSGMFLLPDKRIERDIKELKNTNILYCHHNDKYYNIADLSFILKDGIEIIIVHKSIGDIFIFKDRVLNPTSYCILGKYVDKIIYNDLHLVKHSMLEEIILKEFNIHQYRLDTQRRRCM